jgi:cytosine/adenosine deaminase-related metal-dependent hydrolase
MREHGVTVCCGSDGIRDHWSPFGNGDMLERAMLLAYRSGFREDDDLEYALRTATFGGAKALRINDYGVEVGCAADLVLVDAETLADAVVTRPQRTWVMKRGQFLTDETHSEEIQL